MNTVGAVLVSGLGAVLVVAVLRDVFHTLFHPGGHGSASRQIFRATWRMARVFGGRQRMAELAGPIGIVLVIGMWGLGLVLGGALVYWPHIPEQFSYATGLQPSRRAGFLDAIYLSVTTTTTLGFGDLVPTSAWLLVITPLQALLGFALMTAAVSWVLQIYPALNRRRVLAGRLTSLQRSGFLETLDDGDSAVPALLVHALAADVVQMRVDLTQYAETYFFRARDPTMSLPVALPYAIELANTGGRAARPDLRSAAADLHCALRDLTALIGAQFLGGGGSVDQVAVAYARDHGEAVDWSSAEGTSAGEADGEIQRPP